MSEGVAADTLTRIACSPPGAAASLPRPPDVDPHRLPLAYGDSSQRCELVDGTPIHPRLAVAALATATLRRLVLGSKSEVLDLGRSVRSFPRHLKNALLAAARGRCDEAGCDAPPAWLQADHYLPWSHDGPTAIRNGSIKCDPHNKVKRDQVPP